MGQTFQTRGILPAGFPSLIQDGPHKCLVPRWGKRCCPTRSIAALWLGSTRMSATLSTILSRGVWSDASTKASTCCCRTPTPRPLKMPPPIRNQHKAFITAPMELSRSRTLASDDVPQVVSAAFVYDFPFGHNKRFLNKGGALDRVVGGFQFSPIYRYSRGIPFFFRDNGTCKSYVGACIPGLIPGVNPFLQDPNHFDPSKPLLNLNAFEPYSSFATLGYSGYGRRISNLRGPNFKELDFSLTKNTRITERVTFKFSANFFNAFNAHFFINDESQNFGGDTAFNTDISNPTSAPFGTWNGVVSQPRTIQVAGRIEF